MKNLTHILLQDVSFLDSTKNKLMLIGFLGLFVLLFLNIYAPFDMDKWGQNLYLYYVLIGMSVAAISQFILRPLVFFKNLKFYHVLLWCALDILLIAFMIYLFYSPELNTFSDKWSEYFLTLRYVALILFVPYLLFVFYFNLQQRFLFLKENQEVIETSTNYNSPSLLTIEGENNKVILAINPQHILHVKSSGNYLEIHFLKAGKVSKEIVRMCLKEFETKSQNSRIVRIHRSYLVNLDHIASVEKTRKGYTMLVQHCPNEYLPVSTSYKQNFEQALNFQVSH